MITVKTRVDFLWEIHQLQPIVNAIEIGTLNGDFAMKILSILRPEHLVLIDPFETADKEYASGQKTVYSSKEDFNTVTKRFEDEILSGRIQLIADYSYNAHKLLIDGFYDFIYIDGSHLYEDVKRDLNDYLPKLREGSILAGHDYKNIDNFGVIRAVDEFMKENNFEMVILSGDGDFALRRNLLSKETLNILAQRMRDGIDNDILNQLKKEATLR